MRQIFLFLLLIFSTSFALGAAPAIKGSDLVTAKEENLQFPTSTLATVIVFVSAQCPCSASHEDVLRNLSQEFSEIKFIGIHSNSDETPEITKEHFTQASLPFSILQDERNKWANELGALKTPHVFVFSKNGELIYQGGVTDSHVGPSAKKNFLKEVLDDIRAGKKPRHKEGRALGCYIQREDD
ncbi:redoxin family protein [Bdellovibrio sp. 22V]|uniref:DUF6436 domain-containing protein n=1 Tax=Bdellovibrio TaxID=958 RepID=UPI0025434AD3|nr:redoxin family protein [Bdellovibrio sp. 22V]WII71621.1 redoxin family protein [Bdellovibrio sp. 22V]